MMLANLLSKQLTSTMVSANIISPEDIPIYEYCYEYLFEQILYFSSVLLIGTLLHHFLVSFLFIFTFLPLRYFVGGIHAQNSFQCSMISYGIYFFVLFFTSHSNLHIIRYPQILFAILLFSIILLAPVDHPNKRYDTHKKRLYKICSLIICTIHAFLYITFYFLEHKMYCQELIMCDTIIMISLILGHFTNRNETITENKWGAICY